MNNKQPSVVFYDTELTTREAIVYIFRLTGLVLRNSIKAIDKAAHRWPWAFIFSILLASILTSYVCIGQARAERDKYNKDAAHLQALVDSYTAGKEAKP